MATFDDFLKLDLRVGTIINAEFFPKPKSRLSNWKLTLVRKLVLKLPAHKSPKDIRLKILSDNRLWESSIFHRAGSRDSIRKFWFWADCQNRGTLCC